MSGRASGWSLGLLILQLCSFLCMTYCLSLNPVITLCLILFKHSGTFFQLLKLGGPIIPLPLESNSNIPSLNAPSWYPDWVKSPPHRPSWNPVFLLHCPVAVAHTQGAQWSDYPLLKCNIYSDRNSSLFTMVTPGAAHRQHSTSVRSVSTSIPQILLRAPAALSDQKHTTWPSFPNILSHN